MNFWTPLITSAVLLVIYHGLDFYLQFRYHRNTVSFSSLLITPQYVLALLVGIGEYLLEWLLIPGFKSSSFASLCYVLGLTVAVVGDTFRKLGMVHNNVGFTHLIARQRRPEHTLVTDGVYSLCRHPGYAGWFWWCLGVALMQCNPFTLVAYAVVSWRFFYSRIQTEEYYLVSWFQSDYTKYRSAVPSLIPFLDRALGISHRADGKRRKVD
ncbi:protein-S-isoprenylcysteine O-methyltransferase [Kipferlia bialata]|uniref:Protein-S-isoprenylcysteine O-methyltransferase n=1 Tax=Kipferlia bialata TaxID=797122 RepID=A0A9K3GE44_9EUKA|nr:protein-S-isoprenylcysteine O-methyltransferase [Kipferlia bialata]|eukprot:g1420.t1